MKLQSITATLFIFLFVYTAVSKFISFGIFQTVLQLSPLIGNYSNFIAWMIPITELVIATLLFFPSTRVKGLKASFALMVVFTAYIGYMLAFTPDRPCSCGGVISKLSWQQHLWFNLGLTFIAIISILPTMNKLFIAINPGSASAGGTGRRSRKPV